MSLQSNLVLLSAQVCILDSLLTLCEMGGFFLDARNELMGMGL